MRHLPIEALLFKETQIKTKAAKPPVEPLEPPTHVLLHPRQDQECKQQYRYSLLLAA
jgi:hypothetical protein